MTKFEYGLNILKKEMGEFYVELVELEFDMSVCEFIEEFILEDEEKGFYCNI